MTTFDGYGWACCVEQGHYGHAARKATWLYAAHVELPSLRWGRSQSSTRIDEVFKTSEKRRAARASGRAPVERLGKHERAATPIEFRDLLLQIAMTAAPRREASVSR